METHENNKVFLLMQKIAVIVMMSAILTSVLCAFCVKGIYRKNLVIDKHYWDRMKDYEMTSAEREALQESEIQAEKARIQQNEQSFDAPAMVLRYRMPPEPEPVLEYEPAESVIEPEFETESVSKPKPIAEHVTEINFEVDETENVVEAEVLEPEIEAETEVLEAETEVVENVTIEVEDVEDDWFFSESSMEAVQVETPSYTAPVQQVESWTQADDDVPLIYSLEEFYSWNGIDKEYFLVTLSRVVYVESRGTCREGKVSVAATIVNWARSGLITNLWDILSGYASIDGVDYYQLIWDPVEGPTMESCREAAEAAVNGEDPAGDRMGAHSFYFLDPAKASPYHANIMMQAYHQTWTEPTQLFCGYAGVRWP